MSSAIDFSYDMSSNQGTGSHDLSEGSIKVVSFERYKITLELTPDGKLLRILEVSVNKDFLDHVQRLAALASTGYYDTDEYYRETEEE